MNAGNAFWIQRHALGVELVIQDLLVVPRGDVTIGPSASHLKPFTAPLTLHLQELP